MSINDPIADLLTRIRNALRAGQATVRVPKSILKSQICAVLKREGFIKDYREMEVEGKDVIDLALKYRVDRSPVIQGLRRVSRPSLRVYNRSKKIRPVRSGMGVSILSTSKGVMTGKQARAENLGGEVLCEVW